MSDPPLRRNLVVILLAAFLLGGQAVAVITQTEYWPFSPYPMYADLNTSRSWKVIRLIGLTREGRELTLDSAWLRQSLTRAARHPQGEKRLYNVVTAYLQKYGWTNPIDRTGPKLLAIRIYEQQWSVRADLSNRTMPDETRLLLEVPNKDDGAPPATQP